MTSGNTAYRHFSFRCSPTPVTVAEMLGHARLDTVRTYTRPTAEDRATALNLLPTDR